MITSYKGNNLRAELLMCMRLDVKDEVVDKLSRNFSEFWFTMWRTNIGNINNTFENTYNDT